MKAGRMKATRDAGCGGRNEGHPRRTCVPSYTTLLELSESSSSDVLTAIANPLNGFLDLISGDLRPDMVVLVVRVLAKVCEADFPVKKGRLLASVCRCPGFLTKVATHASGVYMETNQRGQEGAEAFFQDLYLFLDTVVYLLPATACECLRTVLPLVEVGLATASEFRVDPFSALLLKRPAELKAKLRVVVELPISARQHTELLLYQDDDHDLVDQSVQQSEKRNNNIRVYKMVTNEQCGHAYEVPCQLDEKTFPCPLPCEIRLPCGHSCTRACHAEDDVDHQQFKCCQPCARKNAGCRANHRCARECHVECGHCLVEVTAQAPACGHVLRLACSADPAQVECACPCERHLGCGHPCRRRCGEPCGGCDVKVKKQVPGCLHEVTIACSELPARHHCDGACTLQMACGHGCARSCKSECSTRADCAVRVRSSVQPACGHAVDVPCNVQLKNLPATSQELLAYCAEKCATVLKCGHPCAGSCGACLQGRVHLGCQAKCGRYLICGHECRVACSQSCPPCDAKCDVKCQHSRCNQKCGYPCKPCKMPCAWACEHSACTKLCSEACDRRPCYHACKRRLPCGHPCIGFCGEPCPPLCRVCDEEVVATVFFGNEDEPDARFVYLVDCQHTLESVGLEGWLGVAKEAVTMPECPRCRTPIMKTLRYMNQINPILRDVYKIKKKVFGDRAAIRAKKEEILARVAAVSVQLNRMRGRVTVASFFKCSELLKRLNAWLQPLRNNRLNHLSLMELETISLQLAFLEEGASFNQPSGDFQPTYKRLQMRQVYKESAGHFSGSSPSSLNSHADFILSAVCQRDRMGAQEMEDFNLELLRLQRIARFGQLSTLMGLKPPNARAEALKAMAIRLLFRLATYSRDDEVMEILKEWSTIMKCVLTEVERKSIVAAMGFQKGHWYKCPNGHLYCVGDKGVTTFISKCPECKADIGGTGYRMLRTNQRAPEMDN